MRVLLICLICVLSSAYAEDNWNIERLSETEVSSNYEDVVLYEDVAYFANRRGIELFDISDIEEPRFLREILTSGLTNDLFVRDTILFVCDGYAGLRIYSLANPENPIEISVCDEIVAYEMVIDGDCVYVTNGGAVEIVSIEDIFQPELIGRYDERSSTVNIQVFGDFVYFGISTGSWFYVLDVSDKTDPVLDHFVSYEGEYGQWTGLLVVDSLLIVTEVNNLWVYSLEQPSEPELIGTLEGVGGGDNGLMLDDDIYLSRGFDIIDISNPRQPEFIFDMQGFSEYFGRSINTLPPPHCISANYPFTITGDDVGIIAVINVRELGRPRLLYDNYESRSHHSSYLVEANGDYAYVCDAIEYRLGRGGLFQALKVFDVSDPTQPDLITVLDSIDEDFYQIDLIDDDNYLCLSAGGYSYMLSVEDPAEPVKVGRFEHGIYKNFDQYENYIYSRQSSGFYIHDISDPSNPRYIDHIEYIVAPYSRDYAAGLAVTNEHLFVTSTRYGLLTYSLENPEDPELIDITEFEDTPFRVVAKVDYLYWRTSGSLSVILVEDPENPQQVNSFEIEGSYYGSLFIKNNILFIAEGAAGLSLYTLEDPARPELIGYYDTPGSAGDLAVQDNLLYVADHYSFGIYDISRVLGAWYVSIPEMHDFDEVHLDSTSEWDMTISNMSRDDREITSVEIESDLFSCEFDESFNLASNSDTTFTIRFTPTADTAYYDTLTVISGDYTVEVILSGTGVNVSGVADISNIPTEFALYPVYPNPFNASTVINYQLDCDAHVTINVFDLSGRIIDVLYNKVQSVGHHQISYDASNLPSGVYLARLSSVTKSKTIKLVSVK